MDRSVIYDQRARRYEEMARVDSNKHAKRAAWEAEQAAFLRHQAEQVRAHQRRQERTW